MNWIEKHLNWTYGIALILGAITFGIVGFAYDNAIGFVVYLVIVLIGGELVMWKKKRFTQYFYLWIIPPIFAIAVLCASNKRNTRPQLTENNPSKEEVAKDG